MSSKLLKRTRGEEGQHLCGHQYWRQEKKTKNWTFSLFWGKEAPHCRYNTTYLERCPEGCKPPKTAAGQDGALGEVFQACTDQLLTGISLKSPFNYPLKLKSRRFNSYFELQSMSLFPFLFTVESLMSSLPVNKLLIFHFSWKPHNQ